MLPIRSSFPHGARFEPGALLNITYRAVSSLQRLQSMLAELCLEAENQNLQASVDAVRAQHKQTAAQIGFAPQRKAPEKFSF